MCISSKIVFYQMTNLHAGAATYSPTGIFHVDGQVPDDLLPNDHVNVKSLLPLELYSCPGAKFLMILQRERDRKGITRFYCIITMWGIAKVKGTVQRHCTASPETFWGGAHLLPHPISTHIQKIRDLEDRAEAHTHELTPNAARPNLVVFKGTASFLRQYEQ